MALLTGNDAYSRVLQYCNNAPSTDILAGQVKQLMLRKVGTWCVLDEGIVLYKDDTDSFGEFRIFFVMTHPGNDGVLVKNLLKAAMTADNWARERIVFASVPSWTLSIIEECLKEQRQSEAPTVTINSRIWTQYNREVPTNEESTVEVTALQPHEAEFVDSHWTHRTDGSLEILRQSIIHRPSACVRRDGQPVSWAIVQADGTIGALFTLQEHLRQGYARSVIRYLCAQLQAAALPVYCNIRLGNVVSEKLFRSCGFQPLQGSECFVSWLMLGF